MFLLYLYIYLATYYRVIFCRPTAGDSYRHRTLVLLYSSCRQLAASPTPKARRLARIKRFAGPDCASAPPIHRTTSSAGSLASISGNTFLAIFPGILGYCRCVVKRVASVHLESLLSMYSAQLAKLQPRIAGLDLVSLRHVRTPANAGW